MGPRLDAGASEIAMPSTTAAAELRYERATNAIELLLREENIRKIRVRNLLLGDELDALNEKLCEEFERGDEAELDAQNWQVDAEEAHERLERTTTDLRLKTRELDTLKMEMFSLQNVSADSNKLLTEKLALSRELANLRPELEHLRSQASANEGILSEKLSLQRQLNTLQAELENEKRTSQRLVTKQSKSGEQNAHYETQIEELGKDLAKEQRERQKAERVAGKAGEEQMEELRKELAKEKRDRERAEKAASRASEEQIERLKKELGHEKLEHAKLDKATSKADDESLGELRKELTTEKRERQKENKEAGKAEAEWKTQKAVLDDKLDQFRTKLRTTKERLKEVEAELQQARMVASARPSIPEPKTKNPRKRVVTQMDPDAAIGTPGDAGPSKRGKRASSVVGEKSTFSITPFLNRTTSVAPESPSEEQEHQPEHQDQEPVVSIESAASPTTKRVKPASSAPRALALAPASTSKSNSKAGPLARKKTAASLTLEKVTEEDDAIEDGENEPPAAPAPAAHAKANPFKAVLKPKALNSFSSFRDASLPPQEKKKRKLLGSLAKTLFDDDEDNEGLGFGASRGGFGGPRAFGALGGKAFASISLLAGKTKGPLVVAPDGFMFSPLKKDRKAMAAMGR